jgi:two-component system, OmpR family, response regulator
MNKTINILLVDDEADFLSVTEKRLARKGYAVQSTTTCAQAAKIIDGGWPNVVVLDVMLPDKNGIEFLKEIKAKQPGLPVLLLSGHASVQSGIKGIEYGAYDYCLKPVEFDELVEKIGVACRDAGLE